MVLGIKEKTLKLRLYAKETVFISLGRIMRGYDQPRRGQEEKQEKSFYGSYDKEEREERNQV